jgi:hypothetical protein
MHGQKQNTSQGKNLIGIANSKCTFLAFVVVVELGSLSSDMLIVGRDVAGMDGSSLISNDRDRH